MYGQCVSLMCWGNIGSFTFLIWLFISFLLASRVFTVPEFLERRFNASLRQMFACVTVICNVVAFLAAVLYGGALGLQKLFGTELAHLTERLTALWPSALTVYPLSPEQVQLWLATVILAVVAGIWAIYGGLSSVAWTDLFTVIVMVFGGLVVSFLGLKALGGESGSVVEGFNWCYCVVACIAVSLVTPRPPVEKTTDQTIVNWKKLNIFDNLGENWYSNVALWWGIFAVMVIVLIVLFSPIGLS
ncbi:MAG: hypothetical protein U9N87_01245 [Planctomycetota bacterium]|nr:hypothetical protein [Planctomycetota bacterium]